MNTPKAKRDRFNHRNATSTRQHAAKARRLADLLRAARNEFPGFACRIDSFIAQVESDSKRTRSYDREKVIGLLRAWPCGSTVKELMEDTGYTHWDIRQILADLMKRKLVVSQWEVRQSHRVLVYKLA